MESSEVFSYFILIQLVSAILITAGSVLQLDLVNLLNCPSYITFRFFPKTNVLKIRVFIFMKMRRSHSKLRMSGHL